MKPDPPGALQLRLWSDLYSASASPSPVEAIQFEYLLLLAV
jgi:hypothetical protein